MGRGDAVALHQILGKGLAGFDHGGILPGAEAIHADGLQPIHRAQGKGIIRGHHGIVDFVLQGKGDDAVQIRGGNGDAHRVTGDAAVAGQTVKLRNGLVFFQLFHDGVLTPASADDHYSHIVTPI